MYTPSAVRCRFVGVQAASSSPPPPQKKSLEPVHRGHVHRLYFVFERLDGVGDVLHTHLATNQRAAYEKGMRLAVTSNASKSVTIPIITLIYSYSYYSY